MPAIYTASGQAILVDEEDFEDLSQFRWRTVAAGYAARHVRVQGKDTNEYMHRRLLGLKPGERREADHINGVKLDNRRSNLRICDRAQNNWNTGAQSHNRSGYKGVSLAYGKWAAELMVRGKRLRKSGFATPDLAHEFYCLMADMAHEQFANHGA